MTGSVHNETKARGIIRVLCALIYSLMKAKWYGSTEAQPRRTIYMAGDVDPSSNVQTPPQRSQWTSHLPRTNLVTNPNPTPAMEELFFSS